MFLIIMLFEIILFIIDDRLGSSVIVFIVIGSILSLMGVMGNEIEVVLLLLIESSIIVDFLFVGILV